MPRFLIYLFSFFMDIPVEKFQSPLNPYLIVKIFNGKYILDACNVNYSYGRLHDLFVKTFRKIEIHKIPVRDALILGFGGGSIAAMLSDLFPEIVITGVEADRTVIGIADKFFSGKYHPNTKIICGNAFEHVKIQTVKFDLVAIDIYLDDMVPEKFASAEFYKNIAGLLKPGGIVVFNRMLLSHCSEEIITDETERFCRFFPDGYSMKIQENLMLVSRKIG
ncbi:MAG: methyltransferase domain-containing protein [Bacteroidetes bacterium]|nr:methyltransferase domain-containing protein [Bacteroidota bacterium]